MAEIDLLDRYPRSARPIDERGSLIDDDVRAVARRHGREFFDGDRRFGYGGYHYHPRFWSETVARLKAYYGLAEDARILDVGAAKGFLLYDFVRLLSGVEVFGLDISTYAVEHAKPEMKSRLAVVLSINTVHNLPRAECVQAIREIQRVSRRHAFLTVDAWRTEEERRRMEKWVLTAYTVLSTEEWQDLFAEAGYRGDYYWFIA